MAKLEIKYSGKFDKSYIPNEIYSALTKRGIGISIITLSYNPGTSNGTIKYFLIDSEDLPGESELIKILKGIKIEELKLKK